MGAKTMISVRAPAAAPATGRRQDGDEGGDHGQEGAGVGIEIVMEGGEDIIGHEGADHEEFAVDERGDVHDPQQQGQPDGHQGEHAAGDGGVDQDVGAPVEGGVDGQDDGQDDRDAGRRSAPAYESIRHDSSFS